MAKRPYKSVNPARYGGTYAIAPKGEKVEVTQQLLKELFHYDPEEGVFYQKKRTSLRVKEGQRVGSFAHGYAALNIRYRLYYAHRLAWLWVYGEWPKHKIDHIDGDRQNNRIANLRDVPQRVNCENKKRALRNSSSGLLGAHFHSQSGRWRARISVHGKQFELGRFDTAEEAHSAYLTAKRELHEGNTL